MGIVASCRYRHVQRGPWWLLCYALAALLFTVGSSLPVLGLEITVWVAGISLLLLGLSLGHLVAEVFDALQQGPFRRHGLLDVAAHVGGFIETRLLGDKTDAEAGS